MNFIYSLASGDDNQCTVFVLCRTFLPSYLQTPPLQFPRFYNDQAVKKQVHTPPGGVETTGGPAIEEREELDILIVGRSGTGKSTLIGSLFGSGEVERRVMEDFGVPSVTVANLVAEGMAVKALFWNSPGVYDGTSNEHIKKMKDLLSSIDLVVYTLRMDETRMRPEDIEIMQKLTQAFGSSLWRMGILVLTFANRVSYLDDHQTMR